MIWQRNATTIDTNTALQRISIFFIIKPSVILEQTSVFTTGNTLLIWIPCWVSDGMSKSNTINNQHSLISRYQWKRNWIEILWMKWEKEDLINQSISIILFIVNSFDSEVLSSPNRVLNPRVIDWSRIKSHSSISQSFILSNTTRWQAQKA